MYIIVTYDPKSDAVVFYTRTKHKDALALRALLANDLKLKYPQMKVTPKIIDIKADIVVTSPWLG